LDLSDLRIDGPHASPALPTPARRPELPHSAGHNPPESPRSTRPLVPFGGGIDSIVTVESVRSTHADTALFVANWRGDRFEAIEEPAAVTRLPVVRAERALDAALDPRTAGDRGFFNGHVPVTGILSAIAVLTAVLTGRNSVVMSNEWSASSATVDTATGAVNHQYSKSLTFEAGFRQLLAANPAIDVDYFSALRPYSELWVAARFARLPQYHRHFRSCNRAFHMDRGKRLGHWCGRCDKCCFIDLILAPFLPRQELAAIFGGREPLADPALADRFRALIGLTGTSKPFECVGDIGESRTALRLAAARPDRAQTATLHLLAGELTETSPLEATDRDAAVLLQPLGPHFIPADYAPQDLLV
ncbi:MAG: endonuclease domain-containing protein, partial [Frankiaceae bacterium]